MDPVKISDQDRLCGCGHFKNNHAAGSGKCLFAKLQAAYGYPGELECPCGGFVEDPEKTANFLERRANIQRRLDRGEQVVIP